MEQIKEILSLIFGSRLVVEGHGRTFVKVPMWLAVLAGLASIRLAILTAVLVVLAGARRESIRRKAEWILKQLRTTQSTPSDS